MTSLSEVNTTADLSVQMMSESLSGDLRQHILRQRSQIQLLQRQTALLQQELVTLATLPLEMKAEAQECRRLLALSNQHPRLLAIEGVIKKLKEVINKC